MKKLKIAQIAPLWVRVPPEKYGGIELVVYNLTEELSRRGHDVTLFASGDSKTSAKLVSVYPRALLKDKIGWRESAYDIINLTEAFRRAKQFDIIHCHIDLYGLCFAPLSKTPVVHTIHNNIMGDSKIKNGRLFAYRYFQKQNFVSISNKQQKNAVIKLNFAGNVYNGLDPKFYRFNPKPEDKFIWIARMDETKGVLSAILAAEKLGVRLDIAGRIDPVKMPFFETEIKPRLNAKIKFLGEIKDNQKSKFFGSAKALLYPIQWEEPFGLVMTEALACGTPVIAYRQGSVPEIIENGKTGFIAEPLDKKGKINIEGLCEAMQKTCLIDRSYCREQFEKKFSVEAMTDGYEKVYQKILNKK